MITDPAMPVAAPPVAAPRLGLLASAARPELSFAVWRNGITFRPNQSLGDIDPGGVGEDGLAGYTWWLWDAAEDPEPTPPEKAPGSIPDMVTWRPYAVLEADQGTAIGLTADNYLERVRALLTANQSRKMELELWSGRVAQHTGTENDWLANAATLDDLGVGGPTAALAELQQWLLDTQNGRGMIHVQGRLLTFLLASATVRREGNLVLDGFDNLIVAGSGYPGTGPDGAPIAADTTWAYATPMVQVVEDTIDVLPGTLGEAMIRGSNQVLYRAERQVMAWWDNQKNHAGIEVELCDPCGNLTS